MYPETFVVFLPILLLVALGALAWTYFWQSWDNNKKEPLGVLIMAATWSIIFTYFLKGFIDTCNPTNAFSLSFSVIFLEEFIKAFALVNALESIGKRFEEKNDGIIYGAAVGLGFVFVETLYYLQHTTNFWEIYFGRLIYTFPAHMVFAGIFGMYYARAYLGESGIIGKGKKRKQPPFAILANVFTAATDRIPPNEKNPKTIHLAVLRQIFDLITLKITRTYLIFGKHERYTHWSGEMILEGFLVALYLHIAYNLLLGSAFAIFGLIGIIAAFAGLLYRFVQLEKE